MSIRKKLRQLPFRQRVLRGGVLLAIPMAALSALIVLGEPEAYLPWVGAFLAAQVVALAVLLWRRARDYDIRSVRRLFLPRLSVEGRWTRWHRASALRKLQQASDRMARGFETGPVERLRTAAADERQAPSVRRYAAETLRDWEDQRTRKPAGAPRETVRFDVVIVSNLNLPGGTTSCNINDIRLLLEGGKTVGLFHHPLYTSNYSRPINHKIAALIDDDRVRLIEPKQHVECDLLLMRFPPFAMTLMDALPTIEAEHKLLVINQAPLTYYDGVHARKKVWDIARVHENLTNWVGPHQWVTIGPLLKHAFDEFHKDELAGIDLAEEIWYPTLDVSGLSQRSDRPPGDILKLGRHTRDDLAKWPEVAADLRSCYPEGSRYEIRVLGGSNSAARILGRLPDNWVSYDFDAIEVPEFIADLDFFVYYISSTLLEAFGRSPVEAMAAGVPTILPPKFEPVFGEGAIYAEPAEVISVMESLAADPQRYKEQQELGRDSVARRFSFEAHRKRMAAKGIHL